MTLENKGGSNTVTCEHDSRNNMLSKVEAKYRGTAADQRDMKALGKTQELRVMEMNKPQMARVDTWS